MKIDQRTLNNGLNVLFIDSPGCSAGSVQMWFRAGSALENNSNEGIAHFLEHMFFKGTPSRPGPKLAHDIESYGGEVNAFTSFDYTCYYINTPSIFLDKSVDILLDMVANPLFSQEEIPSERQVVFEEYRRAIDNPSQYNFIQLQKSSFEGGYSHPILGNEATILNFSQEQIKSFRKDNYNLQNSLLVVAGNLKEKSSLEKKINSFSLPSGNVSKFENFYLKSQDTINVHDKEIRQATLTICLQAPGYSDNEAAAQDLAINCLAHGETSRLYQALVAKSSICNGVAGSTMYFAKGGVHMIKLNFPVDNLTKALSTFLDVIKSGYNDGFHVEEINKIKNQYIASKVYERESIESYAFSLGHGFAQSGNVFCEDEFIQKISATSSDDVWQGFLKLLNNSTHLTLQVPKGTKISNQENILKKFQQSLKDIYKKSPPAAISPKLTTSSFDSAVKVVDLKPGIKLIHRLNELTPTFVMHTYLKGGQSFENSKNAGIHHLTSRLFNYGYEGFGYEKLKQELETMSASLGGFSGKNAYGLTLHGQTKDFQRLFHHFYQTLTKPEFPQKFFEHERKIIKRSLDNQKEDATKQAFKAFYKMVFHNHPYSLDLAGTPETLKSFNPKKLKNLHSTHLKQSELIITYCGNQDFNTIHSLLNETLKELSPRRPKKAKLKNPKSLIGKREFLKFNREQTQIIIGSAGHSIRDKEDIYLKMISAHLSGQSSKLFVEVRDKKGLCYSVSPIHVSALEAGCWAIYIGAGSDKTDAAISAIQDILDDLKNNGIEKSDFDRIKTMMDGQNLLSIQTNEDYAQFYSIPVLHGLGLDFPHHNNELIRNADYQDFQKFLKKFFSKKWNIVMAGRKN